MAVVIRWYEKTDEEWEQIKPYIPEEQETIPSDRRVYSTKNSKTQNAQAKN